MVELHRADVDQVTDQHQLLALAFHRVDGVARRVAVAGGGAHAGRQFGVAAEWLQVLGVARQRRHRALKKPLLSAGALSILAWLSQKSVSR
jgi:hypothetical protein